jgi:hypothetical protein
MSPEKFKFIVNDKRFHLVRGGMHYGKLYIPYSHMPDFLKLWNGEVEYHAPKCAQKI